MHSKTLTTLLITTAALAAPAPAPEPDTSAYPSIEIIYADVPSSILTVLETAIPTPWLESIYSDPAFRSEEASDVMHGTYPAWYNSLPQSVKDWATSAEMSASEYPYPYSSFVWSEVPYPTPLVGSSVGFSTGVVSSTPFPVTPTASTSTATATETTTKGGEGGSSSASSGSGSGSGSGSSSTSTAGAPAATGGVAMSLAGAAGILGLALAL